MGDHYTLNEDKSVSRAKLEWARWFEKADRRVDATDIQEINVRVSTVFLGINHQWGTGPPLLFESMIFGGDLDEEQERYLTWDEAIEGHANMVRRAKIAGGLTDE